MRCCRMDHIVRSIESRIRQAVVLGAPTQRFVCRLPIHDTQKLGMRGRAVPASEHGVSLVGDIPISIISEWFRTIVDPLIIELQVLDGMGKLSNNTMIILIIIRAGIKVRKLNSYHFHTLHIKLRNFRHGRNIARKLRFGERVLVTGAS